MSKADAESGALVDLGLDGRVILVTGAGRGLGRSYVTTLARHGAQVVVHDGGVDDEGNAPDPDCAAQVAEEIAAAGGTALAVTEVLTDAESCRRVVAATLDRFGRLDGLIHNAGLVAWRDPTKVDQALYDRLSAVSSDAAFWLCHAVLPAMRSQGYGRIVLSTSGWALTPSTGSERLVLYCLGKGAQYGLGMALANAAGDPGILTNLIAPVANTRMYSGDVPPGRLRPEWVAGAVAWLASPACQVSGCLVRAADGTVTLSQMTDVVSRTLGEAAADPLATGAALTEMAKSAAS